MFQSIQFGVWLQDLKGKGAPHTHRENTIMSNSDQLIIIGLATLVFAVVTVYCIVTQRDKKVDGWPTTPLPIGRTLLGVFCIIVGLLFGWGAAVYSPTPTIDVPLSGGIPLFFAFLCFNPKPR